MEMSEATWNHIKEWVEIYKEQFGKLPGEGQLSSFISILDWSRRPSEAIEDKDDEPDEDWEDLNDHLRARIQAFKAVYLVKRLSPLILLIAQRQNPPDEID